MQINQYSYNSINFTSAGIRIGFGELDYVVREENGVAVVLLTKTEPIAEEVTVPIQALTFREFFVDMGRTLSDEFEGVEIPDPAECKKTL